MPSNTSTWKHGWGSLGWLQNMKHETWNHGVDMFHHFPLQEKLFFGNGFQELSWAICRKLLVLISCLQIWFYNQLPSLKLTVRTWKWAGPQRKLAFQPSIFRCYLSFREGISSHPITNRFQVPKMEDSLNLAILGETGGTSLQKPIIYTVYIGFQILPF